MPAAELSFDAGGQVRLAPLSDQQRARVVAGLLSVPLVNEQLAPCWKCNSGQAASAIRAACWPEFELAAECTCAIERTPAAGAREQRYEIRVRGHLSATWSDWFDGLMVRNQDGGDATITGVIRDQAALHGVLVRVHSLNLPLLEVRRVALDIE